MDLRNILSQRKLAYQLTFETEHGKTVLKDLARFCRAHKVTFHEDQRKHALLEGRREVFLRLMEHLQLSDEDLWKLYNGGN